MLLKEVTSSCSVQNRNHDFPQEVWTLIWKVKLPVKIITFVWKVLHDSIPVIPTLKNIGIPTPSTCPFCKIDDESISHLFLYCPFARVVWHGSSLAVHTSELNNVSIQHWIGTVLQRHKLLD